MINRGRRFSRTGAGYLIEGVRGSHKVGNLGGGGGCF